MPDRDLQQKQPGRHIGWSFGASAFRKSTIGNLRCSALSLRLVSSEDVAGVDLVFDVGEGGIKAIGDDGITLGLEGGEVVDDLTAEEGGAVLEGGLVNDKAGTLGLDALHDALDAGLTEIVGVALHRQAIDADGDGLLFLCILVMAGVSVIACLAEDLVGDEVLTGAIALDNGSHHVLRNLVVVGQELFGVLGQTVATIAEAGVVIVVTNTGVEAYTSYDRLGIEALDLCIGVELIEIADAQGKVGIGEELDGFSLLQAHEEDGDVFL